MQKIRVFLNAEASQSGLFDWEKVIRSRLFRSDLEFVRSQTREKFLEEIERAIHDKVDIVVSVGGDGTMHALIQKLAGHGIRFLILPAGTANDLANSLGVKQRKIHQALDHVRKGSTKGIDLIDVNGTFMATNGGIGLVSDVAIAVNQYRRTIPGFRKLMGIAKQEVYGLLVASRFAFQKPEFYHLYVSCEEFEGEIVTPLLLVNNQPLIAASFPVAPHTRHDDGKFNVTFFLHQRKMDFIASTYRIRKGIPPENDPFIRSFETTKLRIESMDGKVLSFIGDGELLAEAKRFDFTIKPQALRVFTETLERIMKQDFSDSVESA